MSNSEVYTELHLEERENTTMPIRGCIQKFPD